MGYIYLVGRLQGTIDKAGAEHRLSVQIIYSEDLIVITIICSFVQSTPELLQLSLLSPPPTHLAYCTPLKYTYNMTSDHKQDLVRSVGHQANHQLQGRWSETILLNQKQTDSILM